MTANNTEIFELLDRLREERPWFDKIMSGVERIIGNKNSRLKELQERVNKLTVYCGQVEAHLAEARAENAELRQKDSEAAGTLRANVAELQLVEAMRELTWFRGREPWVRKHVDHCWFEKGEAVQDWEEANPKPGAGT